VWGVAQLFGHQDLESVTDLRQGMEFEEPRSATENSFSESQSETSGLLSGLGISQYPRLFSSSGQKRKRHGETSSIQAKRSRSESNRLRLNITGLIKEKDDRSEDTIKYSIEQSNATSLIDFIRPNDGSFDNRIFFCLVISPSGRPIHKFVSVKKFLEACRDIIRAYRFLY
jgi:serine/threonine protein kinase